MHLKDFDFDRVFDICVKFEFLESGTFLRVVEDFDTVPPFEATTPAVKHPQIATDVSGVVYLRAFVALLSIVSASLRRQPGAGE